MDVAVLSRAGRPVLARPAPADLRRADAVYNGQGTAQPSGAAVDTDGREPHLVSTCASVGAIQAYTSDVVAAMRSPLAPLSEAGPGAPPEDHFLTSVEVWEGGGGAVGRRERRRSGAAGGDGGGRFAFLTRGSLHLFGSERKLDAERAGGGAGGDPPRYSFHFMASVLESVYRQILFTLTDQVHALYYRSMGRFDVRSRLLGGPGGSESSAAAFRATIRPVHYMLNGAEGEWDDDGDGDIDGGIDACSTPADQKISDENGASLSLSAGCHLLAGVASLPLPPSVRASATRALAAGISAEHAGAPPADAQHPTDAAPPGRTLAALLVVTKDDVSAPPPTVGGRRRRSSIGHCRLVSVVYPPRPAPPPDEGRRWMGRAPPPTPPRADPPPPPLASSDVAALMNFLQSQPGLRFSGRGEMWMPVCLPLVGAGGYVHAYHTSLSGGTDPADHPTAGTDADEEPTGMEKWIGQGLDLGLLLVSDCGELGQFLRFRAAACAVRRALGLAPPPSPKVAVAGAPLRPPDRPKSPPLSRRGSWIVEGILEAFSADLESSIALKYCFACHHFLYRCDVAMTSDVAPAPPAAPPCVLSQVLAPPACSRFPGRAARRRVWAAYERCAARLRGGTSVALFRRGDDSCGDGEGDGFSVQALMGPHPGVHSVTYFFEDRLLFVGMCGPRFELYVALPGKMSVREGLNLCSQLVFKLKADERDLFFSTPYVRRL